MQNLFVVTLLACAAFSHAENGFKDLDGSNNGIPKVRRSLLGWRKSQSSRQEGLTGLSGGKSNEETKEAIGKKVKSIMYKVTNRVLGSALASVDPLVKILFSPMQKEIAKGVLKEGSVDLDALGESALHTVLLGAALAPLENLKAMTAQTKGDVIEGTKKLFTESGALGLTSNLWLIIAKNFAMLWVFAFIQVFMKRVLTQGGTQLTAEKALVADATAQLTSILVSQPLITALNSQAPSGEIGCGAKNSLSAIHGIMAEKGVSGLYKNVEKSIDGAFRALTWTYMLPIMQKKIVDFQEKMEKKI
mmetsp:Transcript_5579/g.8238  ORF Transcript_5579/g.8238 Transcript_5579/m.8238 type:complete len:304 (+) Transcript_5579:49-960(+)